MRYNYRDYEMENKEMRRLAVSMMEVVVVCGKLCAVMKVCRFPTFTFSQDE